MGKADALSRRSDHGLGAGDNQDITLLHPELFAIRALEGITAVGEEQDLLQDIQGWLKTTEPEDPMAKAIIKLCKGHVKSVWLDEWAERDGLLHF